MAKERLSMRKIVEPKKPQLPLCAARQKRLKPRREPVETGDVGRDELADTLPDADVG